MYFSFMYITFYLSKRLTYIKINIAQKYSFKIVKYRKTNESLFTKDLTGDRFDFIKLID